MGYRELVEATIDLFEVDIGEIEGLEDTVVTLDGLIDDLMRTGRNFRDNDQIVALVVEALEVVNSNREGYDGQKVAGFMQKVVDRLRLQLTELTQLALE